MLLLLTAALKTSSISSHTRLTASHPAQQSHQLMVPPTPAAAAAAAEVAAVQKQCYSL
jgi:hypothetical protein